MRKSIFKKFLKALTLYKSGGLLSVMQTLRHNYCDPALQDIAWLLFRVAHQEANPAVTVNGYPLRIHRYDTGISKELAVYRTHEPSTTKLLKSMIGDSMIIVDIGANIGYYTLLFGHAVGPSGRVFAVEPEPRNYDLLRANVRESLLNNITLLNYAVGSKDAVSKLFVANQSNVHTLVKGQKPESKYVKVQEKTLDSIVREVGASNVDLVRMDVEGYEVEILKGAAETLSRYKPIVIMEVHFHLVGNDEISRMLDCLKTFNYKADYIVNRKLDYPWIKKNAVIGERKADIDDVIKLSSSAYCQIVFFRSNK